MEENELILSLKVKTLCTKVAIEEVTEIALQENNTKDAIFEIPRSAMNRVPRLAETNLHIRLGVIICGMGTQYWLIVNKTL